MTEIAGLWGIYFMDLVRAEKIAETISPQDRNELLIALLMTRNFDGHGDHVWDLLEYNKWETRVKQLLEKVPK